MARISALRLTAATLALAAAGTSNTAWADCATTTAGDGIVTLACGNTITSSTINRSGNNPSTIANYQAIEAPLNVTIGSGITITGWGLIVYNGTQPASTTSRPLNVINNGSISHTVGWDDPSESDGLNVGTNSGPIRYSGNGSVTTNGTANATGNFVGSTALALYASGLGNSVTFGSLAVPVSATFSGESGIHMVAENSSLDAWFAGGTITATRRDFGVSALSIQAADTMNLTMTGGTVVTGGIDVSLTAGPGHSASSALTVTTDAQVTNSYVAGAGLTASSREAGANVTLTNGALFNVANIGVLLSPIGGAARFTTAAGTTINQTGTTGAVRTGLWFSPTGTGSLTADLSGAINASGTGMLLQPANGNASVTIRSGGSVSGGTAGIQVLQNAGATGTVTIANAGTLSGATAAINGTPAGTAFTLTNSGTMSGTVNVSGAAVSGSLFTNSGTWNAGTGNSAFSGSMINSGTLNMADGAANTLTVSGNLVLNAGSVLRLDVGSTNAATDKVLVTGTASLAGGVSALPTSGNFTPGTYTILTANGGVSGTFSPLTTQPNAQARLTYDANNVFLVLDSTTGFTASSSTSERVMLNAATVTTNTANAYSTRIIGRIEGGTPLYNQTFAAAFADTSVQNGVTAARTAITAAGGPGIIIGAPVRTASTTSSVTTTGTTTYSLAGMAAVTTAEVLVGPNSTTTGQRTVCTGISTLPGTTLPTCGTGSPINTTVVSGQINTNTNVETTYTIDQSRTDTTTTTLNETYELNGQVVAVGTVHAEVQSGLFDLSGRLLGRLAQVEPGRAGWADAYRFRVSQGGQRDAWGLAGGISLPLGERLTLAAGIGHGNLDIAVPGAAESGTVKLTELGAALRFDSGGFGASLAVVHGFGDAGTSRAAYGKSDARYDVRMTGAALEMGQTFDLGGVTLRPVAGIDWVRISTDGFTETDTLGLVVGKQTHERARASAGLTLARDFGPVMLAVSGRYLAILSGGERNVPVAFALASARSLTMTGPSEPDTAMLGARAILPLGNGVKLSLAYDGKLGSGYTAHSGNLGLSVAF